MAFEAAGKKRQSYSLTTREDAAGEAAEIVSYVVLGIGLHLSSLPVWQYGHETLGH